MGNQTAFSLYHTQHNRSSTNHTILANLQLNFSTHFERLQAQHAAMSVKLFNMNLQFIPVSPAVPKSSLISQFFFVFFLKKKYLF